MRCCHRNKRSFIPQGSEEESPGDDVSRRLSSQKKKKNTTCAHIVEEGSWRKGR